MREFSKFLPAFWTGRTGRAIRNIAPASARKDAQIVAAYLFTNGHANMIGLYRLPIPFIAYETGLDPREVLAAMRVLRDLRFAAYDEENEVVWVCEMARLQVIEGGAPALKPTDNKVKACRTQYATAPRCAFLATFFARYAQILHLEDARESEAGRNLELFADLAEEPPADSPSEAPSPPPSKQGEGAGAGAGTEKELKSVVDPRRSTTLAFGSAGESLKHRGPRGSSKGILQGEQLERFNAFWNAFDYKEGRNAAVGAWLDLKPNASLFADYILPSALAEAARRAELRAQKRTPIMAQGWLSDHRFEDEALLAAGRRIMSAHAKRAAERIKVEDQPLASIDHPQLERELDASADELKVPRRREGESLQTYRGRISVAGLRRQLHLGGIKV